MKRIFKIENTVQILRLIVILLIGIISIVFIIQLREIICQCNSQSLYKLIVNPHFLKFLLVSCFSVLTLYIAGKQLKKQSDVATITALTELRKLLTSEQNRNVHFVLSPKDEQETILQADSTNEEIREKQLIAIDEILRIDVFNYLGTLELGVLMVEHGLIDFDTFYSQFGYRIENIFEEEDSNIHIKIREHINSNKSYYRNLLWGYKKIRKNCLLRRN